MIKTLYVVLFIGLQFSSFGGSSLPDFTAAYNSRKKAVILKWNHTAGVRTYIPQRSLDNGTWTDITLQQTDPAGKDHAFNFEDKKAGPGKNDYRLKCIYEDGKIVYSMIVTIMIALPADGWVMYPVPVTDLLNLDYRGAEAIKGVINIIIQHPTGKIFTRLRYSSLSRQIKIPLNNLPKGIYDIRILVQDEVVWDQRFVK